MLRPIALEARGRLVTAAGIDEATRANALSRMAEQFELVPATFGGDTVAVGAAIMPIEQVIREPDRR